MRSWIFGSVALILAAGIHVGPAAGQNEGMGVLISKSLIIKALTPSIMRTRGIGGGRAWKDAAKLDLRLEFVSKSDKLTAASERQLDVLGEALQDESLKPFRFMIAGHTDGRGSDAYNQQLSERRAAAVKAYLVTKSHIVDARLLTTSFGKTKLRNPLNPLAAENRRVEIINLGP